MKCAMELHDPCKGIVLFTDCGGPTVALCSRHANAWGDRATPFRWQTPEQLERWARDAAERAKRVKAPASTIASRGARLAGYRDGSREG